MQQEPTLNVSDHKYHLARDKQTTAVFLSDSRRNKKKKDCASNCLEIWTILSIDFVRDFVSALSILWTLYGQLLIGCLLRYSSLCSQCSVVQLDPEQIQGSRVVSVFSIRFCPFHCFRLRKSCPNCVHKHLQKPLKIQLEKFPTFNIITKIE